MIIYVSFFLTLSFGIYPSLPKVWCLAIHNRRYLKSGSLHDESTSTTTPMEDETSADGNKAATHDQPKKAKESNEAFIEGYHDKTPELSADKTDLKTNDEKLTNEYDDQMPNEDSIKNDHFRTVIEALTEPVTLRKGMQKVKDFNTIVPVKAEKKHSADLEKGINDDYIQTEFTTIIDFASYERSATELQESAEILPESLQAFTKSDRSKIASLGLSKSSKPFTGSDRRETASLELPGSSNPFTESDKSGAASLESDTTIMIVGFEDNTASIYSKDSLIALEEVRTENFVATEPSTQELQTAKEVLREVSEESPKLFREKIEESTLPIEYRCRKEDISCSECAEISPHCHYSHLDRKCSYSNVTHGNTIYECGTRVFAMDGFLPFYGGIGAVVVVSLLVVVYLAVAFYRKTYMKEAITKEETEEMRDNIRLVREKRHK